MRAEPKSSMCRFGDTMKRVPKYVYEDVKGGMVVRRRNMTKPKVAILLALCKLDKNDVKATAYDSKLQERYYDVVSIAKCIYGDTVFNGAELKESRRTSLNQMLCDLNFDGFVDRTGNRWLGEGGCRDYQKNHHKLTAEGRRCLAAAINGWLPQWMARNRYVGDNGAVPPSEVKRLLNV